MAYKYKLTPLALTDIDEAMGYISERLSNPAAAKRLYKTLLEELEGVCENPYAYPSCACYLIDDDSIRHTLVGNYALIFEVRREGRQINVLRFLYGGRDIANMELL